MSKPLKQRLAEKQAYLERRKRRKSSRVESYSFSLPLAGHPACITEGDAIFFKEKAKSLIDTIRMKSDWVLYVEIKNYLKDLEKPNKKWKWGQAYTETIAVDPVAAVVDPAVETAPAGGVPWPTTHQLLEALNNTIPQQQGGDNATAPTVPVPAIPQIETAGGGRRRRQRG